MSFVPVEQYRYLTLSPVCKSASDLEWTRTSKVLEYGSRRPLQIGHRDTTDGIWRPFSVGRRHTPNGSRRPTQIGCRNPPYEIWRPFPIGRRHPADKSRVCFLVVAFFNRNVTLLEFILGKGGARSRLGRRRGCADAVCCRCRRRPHLHWGVAGSVVHRRCGNMLTADCLTLLCSGGCRTELIRPLAGSASSGIIKHYKKSSRYNRSTSYTWRITKT